jgi:hypothetical protein
MPIRFSPGGESLTRKLFRVIPQGLDVVMVDAVALAIGVSALASVGTATATGDALVAPSGVSAVASVGTATAGVSVSATPAGVSTLASVGSATAAGDALASPSGVSTTASVGSASGAGSAVAGPGGVAVVASVGTAIADGGPADGLASPLGVAMVASVGTATASDGTVVESGGVGSWSRRHHADEPGELRVSVTVFPFGVETTATVGQARAAGDARAAASGVVARATVGHATPSADVLVAPVGAASDVLVGKAAAFDVHVLPVLPYTSVVVEPRSVASHVGTLALSSSIPLADGPASHPAPDAIDRAWTTLQTEEDELLLLGVIV